MGPLCPELFDRLKHRFGEVRISNEGAELQARHVLDPFTGRPKMQVTDPGEYYVVCCPRCNDTRFRLWINHRFAEFQWMIICFNDDCFGAPEVRHHLYLQLFRTRKRKRLFVKPGIKVKPLKGLQEVGLPGDVIPLDQLPSDHPANLYLESRGHDPAELARIFAVSYCPPDGCRFYHAANRIIIPIFMHGKRVGWQARFIGERNWKTAQIPKYYTMPGLEKRQVLYNFDQAMDQPFVVLLEGVTDVWKTGPMAIGVLGAILSQAQRTLLLRSFRDKPLVIMLDGDAYINNEATYEFFRPQCAAGIVKVELPPKVDPGSLTQSTILNLIYSTADSQKVKLPPITAEPLIALGGAAR